MAAETNTLKAAASERTGRASTALLKRRLAVLAILLLIIAAAIVRSSIATRLDSFTFDEAYHTGAGAAYVQTGDLRLNPEQPPLTKLWTGAYVTLLGYKVSPYRSFSDKGDERDFVELDAYENNDPFVLQSQARAAMYALNALLLLGLALAVWRVFGDVMALAVTLFMAIDPTVAAHMPVVMTDLPVALASGAAVLFAAKAFRTWAPGDLIVTALAVGIALSAKHSGIITLSVVGLVGLAMAIVFSRGATAGKRLKRSIAVVCVVIGAMAVLWAFYMFRYNETPGTSDETFNRPLSGKISDVRSPLYRAGLNTMAAAHLFPRAYIWGLADTVRAGLEGRAIQVRAFGTIYYSKAPFYFFPGIIAAKLPIGLSLLAVAGLLLLITRRVPRDSLPAIAVLAVFSLIFLGFLISGSSYAGVRHALPLFPFVAVFAALAIYAAVTSRSYVWRGAVSLMLIAAATSAVTQIRPWEYFNELAGGAENGYLYFNDEGVDLSQRVGEMATYYHQQLEPSGDIPFLAYFSNPADRKARGMDWVGHNRERDAHRLDGEKVTGTFMIGANELGESSWWDVGKPFRGVRPTARLGNVFIFQGTFDKPLAMLARQLNLRAIYGKIYVPEPNISEGIDLLEQSAALDPTAFTNTLELGNQYLSLKDRDNALRAYKLSLQYAPASDSIYQLLEQQVIRLESNPIDQIEAIRNPGLE